MFMRLKYLMDSFTKEPTPTLSELLKRSITRMQGRLDELQQEVDAVQVEFLRQLWKRQRKRRMKLPWSEEGFPRIIQSLESVDVKEDDGRRSDSVGEEKPVIAAEPAETVARSRREPVVKMVKKEEEPVVETVVKEEESKSAVLGESLKLSAGLRHSISLNDSFRFSRENCSEATLI